MRRFLSALAVTMGLALALTACGDGLSEADDHYNSGAALQEQGRPEEAIAEYDEAIRLDPQLAKAYYNRTFAYDDLGQYQRAIEDYDEAIRLDPQLAEAYANRGFAYTNLGQHQRAIQALDEELALAYYNRAFGGPPR